VRREVPECLRHQVDAQAELEREPDHSRDEEDPRGANDEPQRPGLPPDPLGPRLDLAAGEDEETAGPLELNGPNCQPTDDDQPARARQRDEHESDEHHQRPENGDDRPEGDAAAGVRPDELEGDAEPGFQPCGAMRRWSRRDIGFARPLVCRLGCRIGSVRCLYHVAPLPLVAASPTGQYRDREPSHSARPSDFRALFHPAVFAAPVT